MTDQAPLLHLRPDDIAGYRVLELVLDAAWAMEHPEAARQVYRARLRRKLGLPEQELPVKVRPARAVPEFKPLPDSMTAASPRPPHPTPKKKRAPVPPRAPRPERITGQDGRLLTRSDLVAQEFGLHPTTPRYWVREGRVHGERKRCGSTTVLYVDLAQACEYRAGLHEQRQARESSAHVADSTDGLTPSVEVERRYGLAAGRISRLWRNGYVRGILMKEGSVNRLYVDEAELVTYLTDELE